MTSVQTPESQAAASPDEVLSWLRSGNERFVAGEATDHDYLAQAAATVAGQYPLAAVLGCIDSRVPVEAVFDAGIGDVFVARTAGNVVDDDVLGGLEFAAALVGIKAILVLGHTNCGAVQGACDGAELGHLTKLLAKIGPAIETVAGQPTPGSSDAALVGRVIEANVANSVSVLFERSEILRDRVQSGDLKVVGGVYDISSGRVDWLDPTDTTRPGA